MAPEDLLGPFGGLIVGAFLARMFKGSDKQHEHEVRLSVAEQSVKELRDFKTNAERDVKALWREHDKLKSRVKRDYGKDDHAWADEE